MAAMTAGDGNGKHGGNWEPTNQPEPVYQDKKYYIYFQPQRYYCIVCSNSNIRRWEAF